MPDLTAITPTDMSPEEREEFKVMAGAYERRRLRSRIGAAEVADGKALYTQLSYVERADGIVTKMHPDVARQYVEQNEGSRIVREGALPLAKEGEVIGASKATIGLMFDENGRQREDVQPLTSRTFLAEQRVNPQAVQPAVGTTGEATAEKNTGTGNLTSSAVSGEASAPHTPANPRMKPAAAKPDADKD